MRERGNAGRKFGSLLLAFVLALGIASIPSPVWAATILDPGNQFPTADTLTLTDVVNQATLNEGYAQAQGNLTTQSTLLSSYDLRNVNGVDYLAPVRLQNPWNNCWAHAVCASLETNTAIQTGGKNATSLNYAERQLSWVMANPVNEDTKIAGRSVDADQWGEGDIIKFGSGDSASLQGAQPLSAWQGIASESQGIPYTANDGTMSGTSDWSIPESERDLSAVHLSDASALASPVTVGETPDSNNDYPSTYTASATESIKQAVYEKGAVVIDYHAIQSATLKTGESQTRYFNYQYGAQCIPAFHYDQSNPQSEDNTMANHAVCIVGWDDNFSRDHFGTDEPAGDGAFLVRNSWGTGLWGAHAANDDGSESISYTDATGKTYAGLEFVSIDGNTYQVVDSSDTTKVIFDNLTFTDASEYEVIFTDEAGTKMTFDRTPLYTDAPTWGSYFWLSYYDASVIQPMSTVADVPSSSGTYSYDHEYMYDYLGVGSCITTQEGAFDTNGTSGCAANVFTAQSDERLSAVSVSTLTADSKVSISVYLLSDDATNPTQSATGEPVQTTAATIDDAGYHTVTLDSPVLLKKGQRFSVVETIAGKDGGYVPIELAGSADGASVKFVAKCGAGESYLSQDGGKTWTDVHTLSLDDLSGKIVKSEYTFSGIGNAEIRAYTTDWMAVGDFVDGTKTGVTQTGLDAVADETAANAPASTRSASVTLDVEVADAAGTPALAIRALSAATGLSFDSFYDVTLTQTIDGVTTDIGSSNDVLIGVTYPFDFTGKGQVQVFVYHEGNAYELAAEPNADGEYYAADEAAGTVTVFAKRYSTFAFAHGVQPVSPTSPESPTAPTTTVAPTQVTSNVSTGVGASMVGTPKTGDATSALAGTLAAVMGVAMAGAGITLRRRHRS